MHQGVRIEIKITIPLFPRNYQVSEWIIIFYSLASPSCLFRCAFLAFPDRGRKMLRWSWEISIASIPFQLIRWNLSTHGPQEKQSKRYGGSSGAGNLRCMELRRNVKFNVVLHSAVLLYFLGQGFQTLTPSLISSLDRGTVSLELGKGKKEIGFTAFLPISNIFNILVISCDKQH